MFVLEKESYAHGSPVKGYPSAIISLDGSVELIQWTAHVEDSVDGIKNIVLKNFTTCVFIH